MSSGQAVTQFEYRWHQKFANALLGLFGTNWPIFSLDPKSIVAEAQRQTGFIDYGNTSCIEALTKLMQIAEASQLTALGRIMTRSTCVKAIQNRLWLQHWESENKAYFGTVNRPIFIVGLPRSGTTVLQNLISCDPNRRGLPFWEILTPCPIDTRSKVDLRKRHRIGANIVAGAYYMAPEQRFIHRISAESAEECWPIMFNAFAVLNFELAQGFQGWADWLLTHGDMDESYATYRRFLEICQGRLPGQQLVLKCPEHLWFLPQLVSCFPDAEIVWTHRQLNEIVPSYASLSSLIQRTPRGRIDPVSVGQRLSPLIEVGLERGIKARSDLGNQICDVAFNEICLNPIAAVERVYTHFGRTVTDAHRKAMTFYLNAKRSDYRGAHEYNPLIWGLDTDLTGGIGQHYVKACGDYLDQ